MCFSLYSCSHHLAFTNWSTGQRSALWNSIVYNETLFPECKRNAFVPYSRQDHHQRLLILGPSKKKPLVTFRTVFCLSTTQESIFLISYLLYCVLTDLSNEDAFYCSENRSSSFSPHRFRTPGRSATCQEQVQSAQILLDVMWFLWPRPYLKKLGWIRSFALIGRGPDAAAVDSTEELSKKGGRYGRITWFSNKKFYYRRCRTRHL